MNNCKPIKKVPIKQAEYARDPFGAVWQAELKLRVQWYREIMNK